jgi:hypothetical protein
MMRVLCVVYCAFVCNPEMCCSHVSTASESQMGMASYFVVPGVVVYVFDANFDGNSWIMRVSGLLLSFQLMLNWNSQEKQPETLFSRFIFVLERDAIPSRPRFQSHSIAQHYSD